MGTAKAEETYLGDGLYASHDGFSIQLRAPMEGWDMIVHLEPAVFEELVRWREACVKRHELPTSR